MNSGKAGPYGGPVTENYPRQEWWVVATSDEISREPIQRWVLDSPVVLYRKQDGGIVALDDRCPHRWAPLSKGWIEGDDIVCGYHGFQFCPSGDCVRVPTQSRPSKARVKSYPVVERGPLVWLWTGEAAPDGISPSHIPWLEDAGWSGSHGRMEIDANYMLLKENVLDLTHFGYLHRSTFGILDWIMAPDVSIEDGQVEFRLDFPPGPLPPYFGRLTRFGDRNIAQKDWGRCLSPALSEGGRDFIDPAPEPGQRQSVAFRILHATTPISPNRMHYFWFYAFDIELSPEEVAGFSAMTLAGFKEDNGMLTAIQAMIDRDPRGTDYPEYMVATDRSAVEARRMILKQVATQKGNAA